MIKKRYDLRDAQDYISFWVREYALKAEEMSKYGDNYAEHYLGRVYALEMLQGVLSFWMETNQMCDEQNTQEG